ncbi:MAG TPA: RcnB family protein [Allosphingosinicella sp.]|nr:RcnB family protein [Allosphingosinicella sp.]
MRRAFFGFLMAATAAMPIAAQAQDRDRTDGRAERAAARAERNAEHYREQGERNQARSEQRQQRQEARQEVRVQRQERVAPVQQQAQQQQAQSWRRSADSGQRGQRWSGGRSDSNREAYRQRVEETRAANRTSIEQSIGGNYAREGQRNQARTEQQLRREYGIGQRDGRRGGDWNRDGRGDRYGDRRDSRRSSWNHSWRNDSRYDWQRYRYSNRNLFRLGGYYAPYRNYRYNRLSIGLVLDSLFYSNRYWLSDPYQYRLPAAPYGTQWVRYYDDVVLVDVYTGEVLDVIHDFFW